MPGRESSSAGFTLIAILIVVTVMPLVIGALTVGILSVFKLQSSVSDRLGDSGDARGGSGELPERRPECLHDHDRRAARPPAPCGSGYQVLGLQLGNQDQISYNTGANTGGDSASLTRYVCAGGTTSPKSSLVVAHDMPTTALPGASFVSPVTIDFPKGSTAPACVPLDGLPLPSSPPVQSRADGTRRVHLHTELGVTLGVTKVTLNTTTPKNYNYKLVAVPAAGSNTAVLGSPPAPPTSTVGFSTPGTGNPLLGFVDFAPWAALHSAPPANSHCASGQLYMSAGVTKRAPLCPFA